MAEDVKQAVILVGGFGKRLGTLVKNTPKPLLSVAGRPFVEYWLEFLAARGVTEIILSCGYLAEQFIEKYDGSSLGGTKLSCFVEDSPAGTGGIIKLLADRLHPRFLLLNGDSFTAIRLAKLTEVFDNNFENCIAALTLVKLDKADNRYGKVQCSDNGIVTSFGEKKMVERGGLINAGLYVLDRQIVEYSSLPASLEQDILPNLVSRKKVYGLVSDTGLIDIGTPEDYDKAQLILPELVASAG